MVKTTTQPITTKPLLHWLEETQVKGIGLDKILGTRLVSQGITDLYRYEQLRCDIQGINEVHYRFILTLPHGTVCTSQGIVVTPDRVALPESTRKGAIMPADLKRVQRLKSAIKLPGSVATLVSDGCDSFGSLLMDVLPRLRLLQAIGIQYDTLLVNKMDKPFQRDLLLQTGVPESALRECGDRQKFTAEQLIVPSYLAGNAVWNDMLNDMETLHWLRSLFPQTGKTPSRRIYLAQPDTAVPQILNEQDFFPVFKAFHIEVIHPEELTAAAWAKLMSESALVIGRSSPDLYAAVFCQPGAVVIELANPEYWHFNGIINLAAKCGLRFVRIQGDTSIQRPPSKDATLRYAHPMQISPERLRGLLHEYLSVFSL